MNIFNPLAVLKLSENYFTIMFKLLSAWSITILLCAYPRGVFCTLDKFCSISDSYQTSSQGICGQKLSDILQLLCQMTGYNKRSGSDQGVQALPDITNTINGHDPLSNNKAFLSKATASSFLISKKSKWEDLYGKVTNAGHLQQGIVCECCQNRCSMSELTQYCRHPSYSGVDSPLIKRAGLLTKIINIPKDKSKQKVEGTQNLEVTNDVTATATSSKIRSDLNKESIPQNEENIIKETT